MTIAQRGTRMFLFQTTVGISNDPTQQIALRIRLAATVEQRWSVHNVPPGVFVLPELVDFFICEHRHQSTALLVGVLLHQSCFQQVIGQPVIADIFTDIGRIIKQKLSNARIVLDGLDKGFVSLFGLMRHHGVA